MFVRSILGSYFGGSLIGFLGLESRWGHGAKDIFMVAHARHGALEGGDLERSSL